MNTVKAAGIFAAAAFVIAFLASPFDHIVLRLIQYPILLILGGVFMIPVNIIAAVGGSLFGGSALIAAVIAGLLGYTIAAGPNAFAGLGYDDLLQPAYALGLAIPWLRNSPRA